MAQNFDIAGARQAGYSDLEIAQYLQQSGRPATDRQQLLGTPRMMAGPASSYGDSSLTMPTVPDEAIAGGGLAKLRAAQAKIPTVNTTAGGGPVFDPGEQVGSLGLGIVPQNKWEAAGLAAAVIPGGKLLKGAKGALKAGTTALEGAAPEIQSITRDITAKDVLKEALNPKKITYADWLRKTPNAGEGVFDPAEMANPQPAIPGRNLETYPPRFEAPQGVSDRMQAAIANPAVRKIFLEDAQAGQRAMGDKHWYRTSPLYKVFEQIWGPDQAQGEMKKYFDHIAATSPKSVVTDNIRTASYYNYLEQQGLPIPEKPATGYGSVAQGLHRANELELREGGMDPLAHPKPTSFSENFMGDENKVTIDTHDMRALGMASKDPRFLASSVEIPKTLPDGTKIKEKFNPARAFKEGEITMKQALKNPTWWDSAPRASEYGAFEKAQQGWAAELGRPPASFQGDVWVGAGSKTGLGSAPETFMETLAKRIHYTADRMKTTPDVILQKYIKGEIPLLELGAGAAAGAAALSNRNGGREQEQY